MIAGREFPTGLVHQVGMLDREVSGMRVIQIAMLGLGHRLSMERPTPLRAAEAMDLEIITVLG